MPEQRLLIGGRWLDGATTEEVVDRWTGELIGTVHMGDASHATAAVDAAVEAMGQEWPVADRSQALARASLSLQDRKEEFARLITAETGKPITASRSEVDRAIGVLALSAEEARRLPTEAVPLDGTASGWGLVGFTLAEPVGVVAAVTPFNFPLNLVCHKIGPALAAGCAVVLKPSEKARLTAGLLVSVLHGAGVHPGHLNLVTGDPGEVVPAWQADARVAVVTFTGSARIGWQLKAASPKKRHILELGSNTAIVVAHDADLEAAADAAVTSALGNSGQACISAQRVYVHQHVAAEFEALLAARIEAAPCGDPTLDETVVGPLITDRDVERIREWLDEAVAGGARVAVGGEAVGSVMAPALVVNPPRDSRLVCAEVFGPVLTLTPFDELDEAFALVNDSDFGLNTSIFTASLADAFRFAREVRTGTALVNVSPSFRADDMPYGGVKDSGQGREGVRYAVAELVEQKLVILRA